MTDIFTRPRRHPDRRTRVSLKVEDWPSDDKTRWRNAFAEGDLFEAGKGAHLAPSTKRAWENEYGTWLGFLKRSDTGALDEPLAARVTRDRIIGHCEVLAQTNSALSISARLEKLRHALRLLSPETDWTWLLVIIKRISAKAVPRPKGPRYQDILKLDMLGFQLMDDAWSQTIEKQPITLNTALAFRDGLIIAITAATSLRRRNLAQMALNQHVIQIGNGWCVSFQGAETKNKQALDVPLPIELNPYIDFYLRSVRPAFHQADQHQAVWASAKGGALRGGAIYDLICARTKAAFGRATNPHMFRDAAATSISVRTPKNAQAAADLLGHKGLRHTQKHYIRAGGVEAARLLAEAIRKRRR
jgi:integrase